MVIRKKIINFFYIILFSFIFISCYGSWNPWNDDNDVDNRIENLSDISAKLPDSIIKNTGVYNVLILTDLHYGSKKAECPEEELFVWLDGLSETELPKFAISLGDTADTGSQNEYDMFLKFCEKLKKNYGIEMLNVPGNHDLYQGHWNIWKKNCYPHKSFYCFKTENFSWYAIDTASGSVGLKQYHQLEKALKNDKNPKIVYTHYPILEFQLVFGLCDTVERNLLIDLFVKNNVKCSLVGHLHYSASDIIKDYEEFCLPSFKYNKGWTVITVNENKKTVSAKIIS